MTNGLGVDAVLITAATQSTDPVNFAGRILRKKGRVVIVGDVPAGFDREPHYYRKELDLRMSCSYGPGRYDPAYEEKGIDYPASYVRWTEKRNMELFQELLHSRKIDVGHLTTHTFRLDEAPGAYELIMGKQTPFLGIEIEYDPDRTIDRKVALRAENHSGKTDDVTLAFIGAGSYAMSHLLPNLPRQSWIRRKSVMTASGLSARTVAERFKFECCTSDEDAIFEDEAVNTVFIATRHDTHARYVMRALKSGKNVFVEKPLCISETEFTEIAALVDSSHDRGNRLMVGFNRRFSPLVRFISEGLGAGPMSILYRINAGPIPVDSWIQDLEKGGGRIVGEVCHFIDLMTFLNGSLPQKVQAFCLPDPDAHLDTVNVNLQFENGTIGVISYFANGPKNMSKEYLEVYRAGTLGIIKDFREAQILGPKGKKSKKLLFQDKGQAAMVNSFLRAIKEGEKTPIPVEEIMAVTLVTLKAAESLRFGAVISLKDCV